MHRESIATASAPASAGARAASIPPPPKRNGGDKRGSSQDRRRRKIWLLRRFGDGETVQCALGCGRTLTIHTVEADRIIPGGSYAHGNIRPACRQCNAVRGNTPDA